MVKRTKKSKICSKKKTVKAGVPCNNQFPIWLFDKLDKNGEFAFEINDNSFNHSDFLDKMIVYSNKTWNEILRQTHDDNKSKHHLLSYDRLSKLAQERIQFLQLDEYVDSIFSFAFNNTLRVIGIRENGFFHVVWYDQNHGFCPSNKKNT